MNRAQLEKKVIAVLSKNLKKGSKFYADDLASIKAGVRRKTDQELHETLARQNAIDAVSDAEIRVHSQFKF